MQTTSTVPARAAPPHNNALKLDLPNVVFPWMRKCVVEDAYLPRAEVCAVFGTDPAVGISSHTVVPRVAKNQTTGWPEVPW